MISYIKGNLEAKNLDNVVIDVGGIGYKIYMSASSMDKLGEVGNTVKVHTYMRVREDDVSLYGFCTNEELKMFEQLIGVSGVGAKSAISMLSSITPSKFALAVISNDVKTLTKIPGIGPKSAQRIILELKDKLKTEEAIQTNSIELKTSIVENNKLEEAVQALKVLGYTRQEIESVLAKIEVNTLTVEDIIRKALSFLGM